MSVAELEFERKMQTIAAEIAPHLLPRRRDDQPLKEFKLAPEIPEPVGMSGMAEVLAGHFMVGLAYTEDQATSFDICKCGERANDIEQHQAAMLTAAGFGPVKEAKAEAWDEGWSAGAGWPQDDINPYRA